jgi:hypothetical protein
LHSSRHSFAMTRLGKGIVVVTILLEGHTESP